MSRRGSEVSGSAYGSTIAKRRLSRRLTELRLANGFTANQVCDKLDWGRGKVGRFESNTWRRPEMSDVRDLLRLYEKSEEQRRELEDLAIKARERAWWRDYPDVFDNEYAGYEADATRIRVYVPLLVPALLATTAYIEAGMRGGNREPEWRQRALETRLRRQEVLERDDGTAPQFVAVLTEAALRYHWGSRDDRRAQVKHLMEMSKRANIELRIIRFADGPHPGILGPVTVFDFDGDEPSVVFAETDLAVPEISDRAQAETYIESFERTRVAAATPSGTTAYLEKIATTLE
ncbi:MAG: helix-turn-helix domain-containing protein [Streptosporangiales bacterium]|nr:helix-turn-helix domain-containing protein [Streptosporangiales bacterium]